MKKLALFISAFALVSSLTSCSGTDCTKCPSENYNPGPGGESGTNSDDYEE